ncbi:hypothetical protein BJY01DRAFT_4528 [Aspergillus pseudoustus]|uniref:Uncharacterized protein n=1 Tax=Aspergillus pseudoustus TaxID=1810923 RepID=A0ABR4JQS1_9EURO
MLIDTANRNTGRWDPEAAKTQLEKVGHVYFLVVDAAVGFFTNTSRIFQHVGLAHVYSISNLLTGGIQFPVIIPAQFSVRSVAGIFPAPG